MSLKDIQTRVTAHRGFTIVELLIVIVVIGILAAITIVSYGGVTTNARNAGYKADAAQIMKVAETYNADEGVYPTSAGHFTSGTAKLPSSVTVCFSTEDTGDIDTPTDADSGAPTCNETTDWAIYTDTATNTKYYTVKACDTNAGLLIFYVEGTTVKTMSAGDTDAC